MQNAAILANRRAQEVTMATTLARRWQEILRTRRPLVEPPVAAQHGR